MNAFDNEIVLEWIEGLLVYRDYVTNDDHLHIVYTGPDPNTSPPGGLSAPTGSVAFGPSGSWENISPIPGGGIWRKIGTGTVSGDGFLAPNEFYVDPTFVPPGPTGREVATIQAAVALADTLFAAGIAIVIRLREGMDHTWTQPTVAPTRDITILAEGQITGEGIDAAVAGRLILDGAGVKLGTAAVRRRFEIRGLSVQGALLVGPGWAYVASEVTFTGSTLIVNQGGGIGLDGSVTLDRCTDDGNAITDTAKRFRIVTQNHGPASVNRTRFLLDGCIFNTVVTNLDKQAFLSTGNSRVLIRQCSFYIRSEVAFPGVFDAIAPTTLFRFTDTSFVLDSPNDDAALLAGTPTGPATRFLGNCTISVITPLGLPSNDWSIGINSSTVAGALVVELGRPPSRPFPGLVMSDENLYNPFLSGTRGPITKRVFSRKGMAFTGGRKVYGGAIAFDPPVATNTVTWFTPTGGPAVTPSTPTTKALPIPPDQVCAVRIKAVGKEILPVTGVQSHFSFLVVVQKIAGIATIVSGAGSHGPSNGVRLTATINADNEFVLSSSLDGPPNNCDLVVEADFLEV